jgi:hypothetical protein
MPTFLERVRGQDLASADFFVGAVTVVAGLSVRSSAVTLATGTARSRMDTCSCLASQRWRRPCGVAGADEHLARDYRSSFFVAEWLLFLSTGPINVVIVSAVPAGVRAMAMAVSIFVIHAIGDAISPPIIGCWPTAWARPGRADCAMAIAVSGVIWTGPH